ncbi:tetratricopeptide repeat protein [Polynucleobacter sp. 78F-HAINBA]|uniref:O-linked N-acetylglucosamine transferase, SPINDLY family protein n=1 Tax=Polynucleobacter sp. 78F-HAINBA TaxID=2689099 RepID=UPI001C0AD969|nr:tetratricopeptide repeat protein [Polynucleobacter sp. 78F-HAINBA]MBU3591306.1 tetratricopeptide repeat protein [Polynucleobacter sp. 78F-HAINBA]
MSPKDVVALQVHGLSLAMQGRIAESVAPLYKASQLDQKNPELLSNLAKAQQGADLYEDAIQTYKKLDRLIPNNAQILTDMGTALAKSKFYDEAEALFNRAIEIQPDYFLAWSNRGNLLSDLRMSEDAVASYQKALEFNPRYAEGWTNYGNALFALGKYEDAKSAHEEALSIDPDFGEAWSNYGNTLLELKKGDESFNAYDKAFSIKPDIPYLMGQYFAAKINLCIWDESPEIKQLLDLVSVGRKVTLPFNLLQTNASLELQKIGAETFSKDRLPKSRKISLTRFQNLDRGKIRIGYFSSDLREHPVGILMQNLLRLHDRSRFEIYGFFLNLRTGDPIESALLEEFDHVIDLHGVSDSAAIDLIGKSSLDVAIDLNGHTSGARTALFAAEVAPIQINYLGYAGTSGTDFYDALIADRVAVPSEHQVYFSESIAYLPNSFFPVDTSIPVESFGDLPTRASQGLPNSGFVFACFNNAYKITPNIFDVWMRLLNDVAGSILWLSKPSPMAQLNLQKEAERRGVDSSRLIFATRTPGRLEHLSRLRLADLFLDTPNYNAHATAADALWAGLPVLTQIGHTFSGRVAASQITALGFNELIASSEEEYIAKALEFARNPLALESVRQRLEGSRAHSPLFDTKRYVKDLEALYIGLLNKANLH